MAKTKLKAVPTVELELPPKGGDLSIVSNLEEDAHYLRVTLDKAENFKVAVGVRLRDLLADRFAGNRNALRDWYEEAVVEGKAHRAWGTVQPYLSVVVKHGEEAAAEIFAEREERTREIDRERYRKMREIAGSVRAQNAENINNNNDITTSERAPRAPLSEYEQRRRWVSDMNHLWFKGDREWQDRWLRDRNLSRNRSPI